MKYYLKNTWEKYAIIDLKDNILATFRQKLSAITEMRRLQKDYFDEELKIIVIPENKE